MKHWLQAFRLRTLPLAVSSILFGNAVCKPNDVLSSTYSDTPECAPGSGTAKLICRSASGRTSFTADLQDIAGLFEGGKLTIDDASIDFPAVGDCDTGDVVWKPELGLFTLTFSHSTSDGPVWFRFWAIPSTFRTISKDRGSEQGAIYEFDGVIEATEPRTGKGCCTPDIALSCRLVYRI